MGLSKGDAIRNDMTLPNGTLAFKSPTVMGMVEQAQNGVNAPNKPPRTLPQSPLPDNFFRTVSSGICMKMSSTMALIAIKRTINSTVMNRKYSTVSNRLFMI